MSHYVNSIFHPHTIDSTIKSGLVDTGSSGTYTRPDNPHENAHKQGHKYFVSSSCRNNIPSNIARTLELPQFPAEFIDAYLIPGLSHSSLISIGKLCDELCKAIFNEQTVNITGKNM